jgi:tetratricopeptide (TPR) repeat protein
LDPKFLDAYDNKGKALQDLGEFIAAIECYDQAIKMNPNIKEIYCNKGFSLQSLGENKAAIECFNQAL